MAALDLTTLAACKLWLGVDASEPSQDAVIGAEITRMSGMIMGWLNGPSFVKQNRNEYYNGKNTVRLTLRNFPVLSVAALTINGTTVPANPTPPQGAGYLLEVWDGGVPAGLQAVSVSGYWFTSGSQNVQVQYTTGYVATETQIIPNDNTYQLTPIQAQGLCAADAGVTYSNGTALVAVTANPTQGQYVPPNPLAGGAAVSFYQFSAADAGQAVNLSYSFVPWAVEGVCKDLVAERISYRSRIGLKSKTLGGQETMAYQINVVPQWAQVQLQPFASTVPV